MGFSPPLLLMLSMMLLVNSIIIIHCVPIHTATTVNVTSRCSSLSFNECLIAKEEEEEEVLFMDSIGNSFALRGPEKKFLTYNTNGFPKPSIGCNRKPYATCLPVQNRGRKIPENCIYKDNLNRACHL